MPRKSAGPLWIPALAGMTFGKADFKKHGPAFAGPLWIPAFAGMTFGKGDFKKHGPAFACPPGSRLSPG